MCAAGDCVSAAGDCVTAAGILWRDKTSLAHTLLIMTLESIKIVTVILHALGQLAQQLRDAACMGQLA